MHFGSKNYQFLPALLGFFFHHSLEAYALLVFLGAGVLQSTLSLSGVVTEERECNEPQYSSASRSEFNLILSTV